MYAILVPRLGFRWYQDRINEKRLETRPAILPENVGIFVAAGQTFVPGSHEREEVKNGPRDFA